jgi:hypothetical protein
MVVLDYPNIIGAFNLPNDELFSKITNYLYSSNCTIVLEDIRAYSGQLTPNVIDTCKFIGEAVYRLKTSAGLNLELIPRHFVKKWVFDNFQELVVPLVEKKMRKKVFTACDLRTREEVEVWGDGKLYKTRKASFVYIDDIMVTESMRELYKIEKVGKGRRNNGIKSHAWQALAVATYYHRSFETILSRVA